MTFHRIFEKVKYLLLKASFSVEEIEYSSNNCVMIVKDKDSNITYRVSIQPIASSTDTSPQ